MALNQIPYTNVHELNLDWLLSKVQELESRVDEIEDYGDDISELKSELSTLESNLSSLKSTMTASLTALNARCTDIEDTCDTLQESINALYSSVDEDISELTALINSISSSVTSLKSYIDSSNALTLSSAKAYTNERIEALLDYFEDPEQVYITNPWNNEVITIQQMIDYLYSIFNFGAMDCDYFDSLGLTCEEFEALGMTCEEFDTWGKWFIFFAGNYVSETTLLTILADYATKEDIALLATKEELENYATLTDVKVINPVTGILGSMQTALNSLANLHQNGLTAQTFDNLELDCDTLDGLEFTAYEFDFIGLVFFMNEGIITGYTGLTAEQWNQLYIGSGNYIVYIGD